MTSEEFLRPVDQPNIASIPTSVEDLQEESQSLSPEELEAFANATVLSSLQQAFMYWYDRLGHMGIKSMMWLAGKGVLPKKFLDLKDNASLCGSCMFGKCHKCPWRYRNPLPSSVGLESDDAPGAGTSVDDLVSA